MPVKGAHLFLGHRTTCWRCQFNLRNLSLRGIPKQVLSYDVPRGFTTAQSQYASIHPEAANAFPEVSDHIKDHIKLSRKQQDSGGPHRGNVSTWSSPLFSDFDRPRSKVREKLRRWHAENKGADLTYILNDFAPSSINVEDRAVRTDEWPAKVPDDEDATPDQNAIIDAFDRMSTPYEGMEDLIIEFSRGDLVDLAVKSGSNLAVFLTSNGDYNIFYAQDGSLRFTSHNGGLYRARKYFEEDDLEPIIEALPESAYVTKSHEELRDLRTSIPLDKGAHILREMAKFQKSSEDSYRQYSKIMDDLHIHVADESEYKVMRIDQLADAVLRVAQTDRSMLSSYVAFEHATVRAIIRHPFGFIASMRELIQHEEVGIESLKTAREINTACSWIRAYQLRQAALSQDNAQWDKTNRRLAPQADRVQRFLTKCGQLIAQSRSMRPSNQYRQVLSGYIEGDRTLSGSDGIVHSLEFDNDDRCLIGFVMHACHQHFTHNPSLLGLTAVLLRATGAYNDVSETLGIDHEARRNFLIEIGVLQPFSMATALDRDIIRANRAAKDDASHLESAMQNAEIPNLMLDLQDSMSELRKDWGDMLVLAIDKAGTQVVDDGLSIEPLLDEPGIYWLHVHISHISAWMSPDSSLARMASNATQAQYFCEGSIPMLPKCVTKEHSIRDGGTVLTFSMKVNIANGKILEFQMQPGVVHNVKYLDKTRVDDVLGLCDQRNIGVKMSMSVGATRPPDELTPDQEITDEARNACVLLHSVARSISKSLLANTEGVAANLDIIRPRHRIRVVSTQEPSETFSRMDETLTHAKFSTENPAIHWSIRKEKIRVGWNPGDQKASFDETIQTFMMAAGLEAAKWASARNIPMPYFGSGIANESVLEQRERFRSELVQAIHSSGTMDDDMATKLWKYWSTKYGTRLISSKAIPHRGYGMIAYTKITSPLRRYYDLLSMWQIDAALRQEHKQGHHLIDCSSQKHLVFSNNQMKDVINSTEAKQRKQQRVRAANEKHWFCQMLARALYLREDHLPERMTARLGPSDGGRRSAYLFELEHMCWVKQEIGDDGNALNPNDIWEVDIEFVALKSRLVWLRCKRKISDS